MKGHHEFIPKEASTFIVNEEMQSFVMNSKQTNETNLTHASEIPSMQNQSVHQSMLGYINHSNINIHPTNDASFYGEV